MLRLAAQFLVHIIRHPKDLMVISEFDGGNLD